MIATLLGYAFLAIVVGGFTLCATAAILDGGEFIRWCRSWAPQRARLPEVR